MFKTLLFSILLIYHPVHVSITSIDYIPEKESFSVFVRMYYDDFLLDCRSINEDIKNIVLSNNNSSSKIVMEKYIAEKIIIKVNENQLSGKLLDIQLADNEISMNAEYFFGKNPGTITIKSLIMTKLYGDQSNMIIVRINKFEEGIKLTSDLTERTFKIN